MNPVNQKSKLSELSKKRIITLYVNTKLLKFKKDTDLYANFGQGPDISNKAYTVDVNLNDEIEWVGISSSTPDLDTVFITETNFGRSKMMNNKLLIGKKVVRGKVKNGDRGKTAKYSLTFSITSNSKPLAKTFKIDPILRII